MSGTPRPSQKKQASLMSFFTPKSASPAREAITAAASLPSRKRPLEEDTDQGKGKARLSTKPAGKRVRSRVRAEKGATDAAVDVAAVEAVLPSSPLRSSGRTERYVYEEKRERAGEAEAEAEEEDAATRRKKEELHRQFVRKLGHPDSLMRRRRRGGERTAVRDVDVADPTEGSEMEVEGGSGSEAESEAEEEKPARGSGNKTKKGKTNKLTPMEVQFLEIKRQHPDTLLVVEVGYKFRFFGEDARTAGRQLGIVCVPGKMRYDEDASEAHLERFASASIPVPRLAVHVRRLVAAGHKVGVVRQMETAALKKAGDNRNAPFVRRLTSVYTKGTYVDEEMEATTSETSEAKQNGGYILCLTETSVRGGGSGADERVEIGVLAVQPTTGDILYDQFEDGFLRSELETRLLHIAPCELVIVGTLSRTTEKLVQHLSGSAANVFGDRTRVERVAGSPTAAKAHSEVVQFYGRVGGGDGDLDLDRVLALPEAVTICLAAMIQHLVEYGLDHVFSLTKNFASFATRQHVLLGGTTLESLEVYRNATDHGLRGSLLWAVDKTQTRFGHRLLRKWIGRPLLDGRVLAARADAVEELLARDTAAASARRDRLDRLLAASARTDLERSLIRICYGRCTRSELAAVLQALQRIAGAFEDDEGDTGHGLRSPILRNAVAALPAVGPIVGRFLDQIDVDAARRNDKYAFFREPAETDDMTSHKMGIAAVELDLEAQQTVIAETLQTGSKAKAKPYVTVAGIEFLVEVSNTELRHVPASWAKISGTKRVSRFHPPAVARLLRERDQHREALAAACDAAFADLLRAVAACYQPLRDAVTALATLDCLVSLARVAALPGYVRPVVLGEDDRDNEKETAPRLVIRGGRHPVAEHLLPGGYIPFSTEMGGKDEDEDENATASKPPAILITGPNMGGKSSFVRAVALLTLLAQIGSFVPADAMALTLADAIHTRMGARDNLFAGESTFMVEVSETAAILRAATARSLVVLDELGRGTSTHDGAAIAHAVLEHIARDVRCRTLFITHYQSLARVADGLVDHAGLPLVQNVHMRFAARNRGLVGDAGKAEMKNTENTENSENPESPDTDTDNTEITFLYEVAPGMAHRSYGLNVARLARLPQRVIAVANRMSREMEHNTRVRRLQAAAHLTADLLAHPQQPLSAASIAANRLQLLVSTIEQL
ncbi:DNA mismatch repair protein msh3 [Grosmannia clavigera kw1407]|uniref:MutS protein homolog 3 n=1 Tax=Grosmannia clavigera (strain kw1407 / UAMH 11150) TaxID=655863 RepID=F0XRB6_GROCL|nr:DNA mismatch repair protein msh3 [Grosmannia clavigera kw1407]EFW99868.1 DNA mismatch repair protein msh3 [Grosmannia clavigera kw1407]